MVAQQCYHGFQKTSHPRQHSVVCRSTCGCHALFRRFMHNQCTGFSVPQRLTRLQMPATRDPPLPRLLHQAGDSISYLTSAIVRLCLLSSWNKGAF